MSSRRPRRRPGNWTLVCAGHALTLALALTLAFLLAGLRQPLLAWLAGVSLAALAFYGRDKLAAQGGRLRIPERVLLGLALLGGTPGTLLGMLLFRHKTHKGPFLQRLLLVLLGQLIAILAWRVWLARARP